jgi:hypothetical protein
MTREAGATSLPRGIRDRRLAYEVGGETLVYDLDSHKAFCLGPAAARLWEWCDGQTGVSELAERLRSAYGAAFTDGVVEAAVSRLARAGLVGDASHAGRTDVATRRACLRRLALIGGLAVAAVSVPAPSQAASCLSRSDCRRSGGPPCSGLPCCGGGRCQQVGHHCQCR